MDLVDLGVAVAGAGFAFSGYGQGSVVGAASLLGFVGGSLLGTELAAPATDALGLTTSSARPVVALGSVVFTAVLAQVVATTLARRLRQRLRRPALMRADSVLGALLSVVAVLATAWALGHVASNAQNSAVREEVADSALLGGINRLLPSGADHILGSIARLGVQSGFPSVFPRDGEEMSPAVAPPDPRVLALAGVKESFAATVQIDGDAFSCQRRVEGSGFEYARDRVMTNAHVVAGITSPMVTAPGGRTIRARVVLFDPERDVAVLDVPGLDVAPLSFGGPLKASQSGVVAGFPLGGPYTASAARVRLRSTELNYDIYSSRIVPRDEYSLFATVRPGNSGGPLINEDGLVVGVVFATSTRDPETGYALTSAEVAPDARAGITASATVSSQGCD